MFLCVIVLCCGTVARGCNGPPELEHQTLGKAPAGAYNALGAWFAKRQLNSCAISSFESALRADANSWEARYNLGLALVQSGQLQRAADELNKLVKQKPDLAQGYLALGVALQDLGDLQGSEAQLHKALALEPKSAGGITSTRRDAELREALHSGHHLFAAGDGTRTSGFEPPACPERSVI